MFVADKSVLHKLDAHAGHILGRTMWGRLYLLTKPVENVIYWKAYKQALVTVGVTLWTGIGV